MTNINLLDEHEAANALGCSVALLRKWRGAHDGPAYCKIGRLVRYRSEDLDAFLKENRKTPGDGQ